MRVLLIMPRIGTVPRSTYPQGFLCEPLSHAIIAGVSPDDIDVVSCDDRIEEICYEEKFDLVGISVEAFTAQRAYHIAAGFKRRGVPVILGGIHVSLIPEEALNHADAIVIGEAENVWPAVIADLKKKDLKRVYQAKARPSLERLTPKRDIYKQKEYFPYFLVEFSRGCLFNCSFCSMGSFFRQSSQERSIDLVVEEIARLPHKNIFLIDDNIMTNRVQIKRLLKELIDLRVRWFGHATIDIAGDEELLELVRRSGCVSLWIGFETLHKGNLDQLKKGWAIRQRSYREAMKIIRSHGVPVYASFLFGSDNDDNDVFKRTLDFAMEQKFFYALFFPLFPFPGTPLYDQLRSQDRLLEPHWWSKKTFRLGDPIFKPKLLAPDAVSQGCREITHSFLKNSSLLKRALDVQSNSRTIRSAIKFFLSNLFLRGEIDRWYTFSLGADHELEKKGAVE